VLVSRAGRHTGGGCHGQAGRRVLVAARNASHPEAAGGIPCVVFFAGSGPTDRDWLSPLLPGTNGSGRALADGVVEAISAFVVANRT